MAELKIAKADLETRKIIYKDRSKSRAVRIVEEIKDLEAELKANRLFRAKKAERAGKETTLKGGGKCPSGRKVPVFSPSR